MNNDIIGQLKLKSVVNENGCWMWTGAVNGTKTPAVYWDGTVVSVRSVIRSALGLAIGEGFRAATTCKQPLCVNPDHMRIVAQKPKKKPGFCAASELRKEEIIEPRFWKRVQIGAAEECWPWIGGKTGRGYGYLWRYTADGKRLLTFAHRASYALQHGSAPAGMAICHKCDNPICVNPNHLFAGSTLDNIRDCVSKGRLLPPKSKLNQSQVDEIRAMFAADKSLSKPLIANRYGVTRASLYRILNGKHWATRRIEPVSSDSVHTSSTPVA